LFLVGFNILRTVALDLARRLSTPMARWTHKLAAQVVAWLCACVLVVPTVTQLLTYSVATKFNAAHTSTLDPNSSVLVAPAVVLVRACWVGGYFLAT
jgi:hypothetical protein